VRREKFFSEEVVISTCPKAQGVLSMMPGDKDYSGEASKENVGYVEDFPPILRAMRSDQKVLSKVVSVRLHILEEMEKKIAFVAQWGTED
jgi:hypothetical protein